MLIAPNGRSVIAESHEDISGGSLPPLPWRVRLLKACETIWPLKAGNSFYPLLSRAGHMLPLVGFFLWFRTTIHLAHADFNRKQEFSRANERWFARWEGLRMRVLALLILLTSTLGAQATDYRRYIRKNVLPLHDLLLKKQFLVIPNPPTCKANRLMRGYFI